MPKNKWNSEPTQIDFSDEGLLLLLDDKNLFNPIYQEEPTNGLKSSLTGFLCDTKRIKLKDFSLHDLYPILSVCDSLYQAAHELKVKDDTLARHLSRYVYKGKRLSFSLIRTLTSLDLQAEFLTSYFQPLVRDRIKISDYSLTELYKCVRRTSSLREAANNLGVTDNTLQRYLGQLTYNDEFLSYQLVKQLNKNQLASIVFSVKKHPMRPARNMPPPSTSIDSVRGPQHLSKLHIEAPLQFDVEPPNSVESECRSPALQQPIDDLAHLYFSASVAGNTSGFFYTGPGVTDQLNASSKTDINLDEHDGDPFQFIS